MPIMLAQADISKALYTCSFGDGDGKADASVKLGAAGNPDVFVPNINALKWGNEAWLNLNPSWFAVGKSSVCDFQDKVASAQVGDVLIKTWALNKSVLEYAVVFSSVPAQENIELDILQSGGLDWWFQGELTEDDIKEGCVRPDRVVGSYALYYAKSNNEYKTGKFAHLFRWECIAADGQKAWCGHLYKDGNKLIIPLPVDWLKKAKYPVICMGAGDTFGFTSVGGTQSQTLTAGVGRGTYASPASNGTVKSVAFYTTSDATYKVSLYTAAGDLVSAQNTGASATASAWNTMSVPDAAVSSGTTYIPLCKRSASTYLYYDDLAAGAGYASNAYSTDWPATLSFTNTDRKYSIYANYEPSTTLKSVTDAGAGSDALAQIAVALSLADTGSGADAFGSLAAAVPIAEAASGADAIAQIAALLALMDSGAGSDSLAQIAALLALMDSGAGSDSLAQIAAALSLTEAGSGADAIAQIAALLAVADSGQGVDTAQVLILIAVSDAASGADAIASINVTLAVTDIASGAEAPAILAQFTVADAGQGVDSIGILQDILKAIADAGTGLDGVAGISALLPVSDDGAAADALAQIAVALSLAEAGSGADAVAQIAALLSVADSGQGVDTAQALILIAVSDAASGADALYAVSVSAPVADWGSASDAIASVNVTLSVADAASGADDPAILAQFTVADAGQGVDYIGILQDVLKAIADAGAGLDSVAGISAVIPVADAGAAADYIGFISALLSIAEAAVGTDVIVKFTSSNTYRRVDITFTPRHGRVTFAARQGGVVFLPKSAGVNFDA